MNTFLFYFLNTFIKASLILLQLLPYLIVGTIIGEALKYIKLHKFVGKTRMKGGFLPTFAASVLGMVSPLCTYGTVPVVIQLNNSGVPASLLIVFLISSSMMNPQLFFMTWGGIGIKMALARIISIMIFSLLMVWILSILPAKWILNKKSLAESKKDCCDMHHPKKIFTWKSYGISILKSLEFTGLYIVIGVLLAAAIEVVVPANFANALFQQDKILQVLAVAVLSIPFYTCGGGAIPVVNSLISGGMSNGTALAFLNVGSATRVTTLAALGSIVRPLFLFAYVLILMLFSLVTGYIFI